MSYTSVDEVPFNIRLCYDEKDIIQWMSAYNNACDRIADGTYEVPPYCLSPAMYAREMAFDSCKYLPSSRFVESSATVEVVDKQGEVADIESYLEASRDFIEKGGIGIEQHSSKVISVVWKAYEGIDEGTGKPAIFVCENYFRGSKMYDDAWQGVLNGALQEKSIGSRIDPEKSQRECDEQGCHLRIFADQWFELSSVFRGANPRTGILDMNEAIKSLGNAHIVDCNRNHDMCPIKQNYLNFKEDISKIDASASTHYLSDGTIYVKGDDLSKFKGVISNHYPDIEPMDAEIKGVGKFTFIIDRTKGEYTDLDVFDELMVQVDNERDAIAQYTSAMEYIDTTDLSDEDKAKAKDIIREIISDEQKHIGCLERLATILDKKFNKNLFGGMVEANTILKAENAVDGCPPGQHEHAGVVGCHDITRSHGYEKDSEESIGAPKEHELSIDELRKILVVQAKILSQYPKAEIDEFLQTPSGKQFISMYLAYQRKRKASDKTESSRMKEEVKMTVEEDAPTVEEVKECKEDVVLKEAIPEGIPPAPMPEDADVEAIPEGTPSEPPEEVPLPEAEGVEDLKADMDLPTAIANIASAIVYIKAKIETVCARLDGLEDMVKIQGEVKDTVAEQVLSDVSVPIDDDVAEISPVKEETDAEAESEEKESTESEVKETVETDDKPIEEEVKEEVVEEDVEKDDTPKDDDEKTESDDDKSAEKPTEDDKGEEKEIEKKKSDITFEDVFEASSALSRRVEELRLKGVDMEALMGNPASITSTPMGVSAVDSTVSIVNTPAPAPYTPASVSVDGSKADSFDSLMSDMGTMSTKQFSDRIKGLVKK